MQTSTHKYTRVCACMCLCTCVQIYALYIYTNVLHAILTEECIWVYTYEHIFIYIYIRARQGAGTCNFDKLAREKARCHSELGRLPATRLGKDQQHITKTRAPRLRSSHCSRRTSDAHLGNAPRRESASSSDNLFGIGVIHGHSKPFLD